MALEQEGKLLKKLEQRSGVSANNTNWSSQDFVLEIPGQYVQYAVFNVFNNRIPLDQFQEGEYVKVSFDIRGREYQGRWFNTLNAWRIDRAGNGNVTQTTTPPPTGGGTNNTNTTQTGPEGAVEQPQPESDDLPF